MSPALPGVGSGLYSPEQPCAISLDAAESLEDQLRRCAATMGRTVHQGAGWLHVTNPALPTMAHGWKIHISARPSTLYATLERAMPILLSRPCHFKTVPDPRQLRLMNGSGAPPAGVGKAVTVYPLADACVEIAVELGKVLKGFAAPRIVSDRRLRPDAPVYYRYGPYVPHFRATGNGSLELSMSGPNGQHFPGAATESYLQPDWAENPFEEPPQPPRELGDASTPPSSTVLGGRFRLTTRVSQSPRGGVYRALDLHTGENVVLKEARAYVDEDEQGEDARTYLRNERRILQYLVDLDVVPKVVDHFRHGDDEFLAVTSVGSRDLRQQVFEQGCYRDVAGCEHNLLALAKELLALLDAVHGKGVIVRDFAPKNVVLTEAGRYSPVDFDISSFQGLHRFGYTPGYSAPDQQHNRAPDVSDDYYALGATLYFAATGLEPIRMEASPEDNIARTLASLRYVGTCGERMMTVLTGLLSMRGTERIAAAEYLRKEVSLTDTGESAMREPPRSPVSAGMVDRLTQQTLLENLRYAESYLSGRRDQPIPTCLYLGSSGLLAELLHHRESEEALACARSLASCTSNAFPLGDPPPGLLFGSTGTAVALVRAGAALADDSLVAEGEDIARRDVDSLASVESWDLASGFAGIGLGHLLVYDACHEDANLEVATRCAHRLMASSWSFNSTEPSTLGFAHGAAGVAYFLTMYAQAVGEAAALEVARSCYEMIAEAVPGLIEASRGPSARPMSASWCQGLAGISSSLMQAASALSRPHYLALASEGASACADMAPRMSVVSQCCGLAGVGELFIDLGVATGDLQHFERAEHVLAIMLSRCGGDLAHPKFPDHSLLGSSGEWAVGSAGVLSFLRRLRARGGPKMLSSW